MNLKEEIENATPFTLDMLDQRMKEIRRFYQLRSLLDKVLGPSLYNLEAPFFELVISPITHIEIPSIIEVFYSLGLLSARHRLLDDNGTQHYMLTCEYYGSQYICPITKEEQEAFHKFQDSNELLEFRDKLMLKLVPLTPTE